MTRLAAATFAAVLVVAGPVHAESICEPDGTQASGSVYRICMPAPGEYNGILVIWAHGFQDAGTAVQIPEDQLCFGDTCLPDLVNGLGFGFATNSYSKTGLAVLQGKDDIVDLVRIFSAEKGPPRKVYLVGASEGGLITTLALEQRPDLFSAGLAACGPIGSFPLQINYFGDGRVTFEYLLSGPDSRGSAQSRPVARRDVGRLLPAGGETRRLAPGQPPQTGSIRRGCEVAVRPGGLPRQRGTVGARCPQLCRREPQGRQRHPRRIPVRQPNALVHGVGRRQAAQPSGVTRFG